MQQCLVQRFEEAQVVMGYGEPFFRFCPFDGVCGSISYRSDGDDGNILSVLQFAPFAHGDFFERTLPVHQYASSAGITDNERTFVRQLCRVHEAAQFMFVHGRGYGQVRDRAEVGKVVYAMMRRAILSHQSGAVQTKDNGQPQEGNVVYHIVVCPLHERRVDVAEGLHAFLCHAAGECGCVPFGNAYIECTVGHGLHQ